MMQKGGRSPSSKRLALHPSAPIQWLVLPMSVHAVIFVHAVVFASFPTALNLEKQSNLMMKSTSAKFATCLWVCFRAPGCWTNRRSRCWQLILPCLRWPTRWIQKKSHDPC